MNILANQEEPTGELLRAHAEMGVKPHIHKFVIISEELVENPTWLLRRRRFYFEKCCGKRQIRMTKEITQACTICENTVVYKNGDKLGFCEVCGGVEDHTPIDSMY